MAIGNNNIGRGYRGNIKPMEAFDRLPKAVREALANSDHNWASAQVYKEMHKPKARRRPQMANAAAVVAFLRESDARQHAEDVAAGLVAP